MLLVVFATIAFAVNAKEESIEESELGSWWPDWWPWPKEDPTIVKIRKFIFTQARTYLNGFIDGYEDKKHNLTERYCLNNRFQEKFMDAIAWTVVRIATL